MQNPFDETSPKKISDEEMDALYEKAEMDLLRDALKKTDTERFLMMTTLMKLNNTLQNATITFTPYTLNK
jgi:hypothetical protein